MTQSLGGAVRAWIAALLGATFGLVACIETASLGAGPAGAGGEVGSGDALPSTGGTSAGSVGGGLVGAGGGAGEGAVAGGSAGTGGDIYVGGTGGMQPACDVEAVLRASCGRVGCHDARSRVAELDLHTPGVQARLIDVPATYADISCPDPNGGPLPVVCVPATCVPGAKLIDLENPENSVLLRKIAGTQSCGEPMPIAPGTLSDSDRTCLEEWLYPHPPVVR